MSEERLVRNAGLSSLAYVVGSIASLLLVPVLLHVLGAARFGLFVVAQTTTSFASLATSGLNRGFLRSLAARDAVQSRGGARDVVGTGLTLSVLLGMGVLVMLTALYPLLIVVFHVPTQELPGFAWALGGVAVAFAAAVAVSPYRALLMASRRLDLLKSCESVMIVLNSLLSAAVVLNGFGLRGLGSISAITGVLGSLALVGLARFVRPDAAASPPGLKRGILRELWDYGVRIQTMTLAGVVNRSVDRVTLGVLRPASALASYDVADRAAYSMVFTANSLAEALAPGMAARMACDDLNATRELYRKSTAAFCLASTMIGAFAVFQARTILRVWLGSAPTVTVSTLATLAAGYAVLVSLSASSLVAMSEPRPTLAMRYSLIQAVGNTVLSFAGAWIAGVVGAAIGSAVSGSIGGIALSVLVERRLLKSRSLTGLSTLLRAIGVTVPIAAAVWFVTVSIERMTGAGRVLSLGLLGTAFLSQAALSLVVAVRLKLMPSTAIGAVVTKVQAVLPVRYRESGGSGTEPAQDGGSSAESASGTWGDRP